MWLSGSRPDVLERIAGGSPWKGNGPGPFNLYPNDYHRVQSWKSGNHTWKCVSKVLAWASGEQDWQALLGQSSNAPRLGDLAYQIELSARPSLHTSSGAAPTADRQAFLRSVISTLRPTARVLLFHGAEYPEATEKRHELARLFLGLTEDAFPEPNEELVGTTLVRWIARGDRVVLYTRALSMAVSDAYLKAVAQHVGGAIRST